MCGIFGIIDFAGIKEADPLKVKSASSVMILRGPDFQGFYQDEQACVGHNRLKILDLSNEANQPFVYYERFVIVFNGEIYNYKEIRLKLESNGLEFNTNSDTEVLVAGYSYYGEEIVKLCRGMWSFVIWDKLEKKIFASRDRFGEKPFYYFHDDKRFLFASNISGMKKLMGGYHLNYNAIAELIGNSYISSGQCILQKVNKLKAASNLTFNSGDFEIKKYWEVDYSTKIDVSFEETLNTVDELLHDSVREKLMADVEVGLFLSSGIDSTLVAAIAGQYSSKIKTITLAASDPAMDESSRAHKIADQLGLDNEIVKEQEDYFSVLSSMYKSIEPIADSSILPSYSVSKAAKGKFTVVLTGDGGDEIFGGYTNPIKALVCNSNSTLFSSIIDYCVDNKFRPGMGYLKRFTGTNTIFRYGGFYSFLKRKDQLSVYIKSQVFTGKAINQISLSKGENFINDPANNRNINYHDKVLLNGINTTLVDDFLYKMDAATMANSIESRPPFLDHRIIEFTSKLKTLGLMPNKIDKEVTRTLAYKYVPKELVDTPKLGFSIPVKKYFKAEWAKTLLDKMDGKKIMDLEIFNKKGIEKLLNDYKTNDFDQLEKVFFGILSFILWYETFDEN